MGGGKLFRMERKGLEQRLGGLRTSRGASEGKTSRRREQHMEAGRWAHRLGKAR